MLLYSLDEIRNIYKQWCEEKLVTHSWGEYVQIEDDLGMSIVIDHWHCYITITDLSCDDTLQVGISKQGKIDYTCQSDEGDEEAAYSLKVWNKLHELLNALIGDNNEENS